MPNRPVLFRRRLLQSLALALVCAAACGDDAEDRCWGDSFEVEETLSSAEVDALLSDWGETEISAMECERYCQRAGELRYEYDYIQLDRWTPECLFSIGEDAMGAPDGTVDVNCWIQAVDAC